MLDKLFSIFSQSSIHRVSFVTSLASNVIKAIDQECAKEPNVKDAIIDVLIATLQSNKSASAQLTTTTVITPSTTPTNSTSTTK
jgi:hypothetical protein